VTAGSKLTPAAAGEAIGSPQPDTGSGAPSPGLAPPAGNPRFPLFDGLRGIAVLSVLALHAAELSGRVGFGVGGRLADGIGGEGVIVFFVISGFLLYRPFAAAAADGRPGPAPMRYARRRALRIVPGYWAVLTILAVFPGIVGVFTGDWWRYYGYLQIYSSRTTGGGIAVAWTLCVEVTFYLALPVWALAMRRVRRGPGLGAFLCTELAGMAGLALLGLGIQIGAADHRVSAMLGSSLVGESLWFAVGMALAVCSVTAQRDESRCGWLRAVAERSGLCWAFGAAALAGLMAMDPAGGLFGLIAQAAQPQPLTRTVLKLSLQAVLVAGLVAPAVFGRRSSGRPGGALGRRDLPRRLLGSRPLVGLGVISYSFYLWHLTITQFIAVGSNPGSYSVTGLNLMGHVHTFRMTILFVASFTVTVAISTASYRFIELPFLRRKEGPATSA
jgi:peptidoglycan/LPS O-acetylase OafA/YrhL